MHVRGRAEFLQKKICDVGLGRNKEQTNNAE